nr:hypothetical protein CFP56_79525 [Quercus suber]
MTQKVELCLHHLSAISSDDQGTELKLGCCPPAAVENRVEKYSEQCESVPDVQYLMYDRPGHEALLNDSYPWKSCVYMTRLST